MALRVLHINQSDTFGGAALAGYRLHQGLLAQQVDSRLLVGRAEQVSDRTEEIPPATRTEKRLQRLTEPLGFKHIHLLSTVKLRQHPFYQTADVLNLHNLHNSFFNYLAIPTLAKKPTVLTLHDMWTMTGHCSFSPDCDRWKIGCGHCPDLSIFPPMQRDSTRWEWRLKRWAYAHANLAIVAPSRWLAEVARQSPLFQRFSVHHIPYGIDTTVYQPLDSAFCRQTLNIPPSKKVLLFVAHSIHEQRKGSDLLFAALSCLPQALKSELLLLIMGQGDSIVQTGIETIALGYVRDDHAKAIAYCAADLFVFPTRADNLPLVLQESLACGTPMISCDVGGVSDLVRSGVTGYLAAPENIEDLRHGIVSLLADEPLRRQMQRNCRAIALSDYTLQHQTQAYINLYQELLQDA